MRGPPKAKSGTVQDRVEFRGDRCRAEGADAGHGRQHLNGAEGAGSLVRVLAGRGNRMDRRGGERTFSLPLETPDLHVIDGLARVALQHPSVGRRHSQLGEFDRTSRREGYVAQ
jgi:hypothetical protein